MTTPPDDLDALRVDLQRAGRRYSDARDTVKDLGVELAALAAKAHEAGLRYSDIARGTGHALTSERIRQMVNESRSTTS